MIVPNTVRRLALPVAAFVLVGTGAMLALPDSSGPDSTTMKQPTVVLVDSVSAGTPSLEVRSRAEVRDVEASARAEGALSSLDDIPAGVLAADHVKGQQLLVSSFADNVVQAVGDGYVAVSVRLDSQRWMGPIKTTGESVNAYSITNGEATLVSQNARILDSPEIADLKPRDDAIVTLAVRRETLGAVLVAATEDRLWLTGQ